MINQQPQFATNKNIKKIKSKIKLTKMQHPNEELQKRLNELNREQGASSRLTTIPLSEEGYNLTVLPRVSTVAQVESGLLWTSRVGL